MIAWQEIIGQEAVIARIRHLLDADRLPHALLFTGPESVGKYLTAKTLAGALLCKSSDAPCGVCQACRMVEEESHPDLVIVRAEKMNIKIEQIRAMQKELALSPYMADCRVCIIDDADKMAPVAANSLLKTLEEPVGRVVFILVTSKRYQMLDTIRSRCMLIAFGAISSASLAKALIARGAEEKEAHLAARLAGGRFALAEMILSADGQTDREEAIKLFFAVPTMAESDIWKIASQWDACERQDVLARMASIHQLVRDAMVFAAGFQEAIINTDCMTHFARTESAWTLRMLSLAMRELVKRERSVKNNGNIKLVIEAMLLKWRSLVQRR